MMGKARGLGGRRWLVRVLVKMVRKRMKETNHMRRRTRYSWKFAIMVEW